MATGSPSTWSGSPSSATGIERVLPAEQFGTYPGRPRQPTARSYTMFKPEELGPENSNEKFNALQRAMTQNPWDGRLTRELQFVKLLKERFPQSDIRDCSAFVWNLRKYKSAAELAVMREAGRIGVAAHIALIRSTRPGTPEKALAAVFEFVVRKAGAQGLAYPTIIFAEQFRGIVRLGGYNHSIGMATHDVMGTFAGPDEVLAPGFVFACDIQLFSLDEEIGIRIEDTIAITEAGHENLSPGLPRTVAEIEALMKTGGMLQVLEGKGR